MELPQEVLGLLDGYHSVGVGETCVVCAEGRSFMFTGRRLFWCCISWGFEYIHVPDGTLVEVVDVDSSDPSIVTVRILRSSSAPSIENMVGTMRASWLLREEAEEALADGIVIDISSALTGKPAAGSPMASPSSVSASSIPVHAPVAPHKSLFDRFRELFSHGGGPSSGAAQPPAGFAPSSGLAAAFEGVAVESQHPPQHLQQPHVHQHQHQHLFDEQLIAAAVSPQLNGQPAPDSMSDGRGGTGSGGKSDGKRKGKGKAKSKRKKGKKGSARGKAREATLSGMSDAPAVAEAEEDGKMGNDTTVEDVDEKQRSGMEELQLDSASSSQTPKPEEETEETEEDMEEERSSNGSVVSKQFHLPSGSVASHMLEPFLRQLSRHLRRYSDFFPLLLDGLPRQMHGQVFRQLCGAVRTEFSRKLFFLSELKGALVEVCCTGVDTLELFFNFGGSNTNQVSVPSMPKWVIESKHPNDPYLVHKLNAVKPTETESRKFIVRDRLLFSLSHGGIRMVREGDITYKALIKFNAGIRTVHGTRQVEVDSKGRPFLECGVDGKPIIEGRHYVPCEYEDWVVVSILGTETWIGLPPISDP